jgi:hypothetical protein
MSRMSILVDKRLNVVPVKDLGNAAQKIANAVRKGT